MRLILRLMWQQRTSPGAPFICRYTGKDIIIFYYVLALVAIGAVLLLVVANETTGDALERMSWQRDERRSLLFWFSLFGVVLSVDFLLQLRAFMQDRPALVMDAKGAAGLHGGLWREIAWDDLHEIEITGRYIRFVRRPRNALSRWIFSLKSQRLRLGEYCIVVLIKRIDSRKDDILRTIRHHRPDLV